MLTAGKFSGKIVPLDTASGTAVVVTSQCHSLLGGMEPIVFWIHPMVCLVGST